MVGVFECVMLVCFGVSWPISVYKSYTSKSTKGKSAVFMIAILVGYISGICGKILGNQINYVLFLYILNFIIVSVDFCLFLHNKHLENKTA